MLVVVVLRLFILIVILILLRQWLYIGCMDISFFYDYFAALAFPHWLLMFRHRIHSFQLHVWAILLLSVDFNDFTCFAFVITCNHLNRVANNKASLNIPFDPLGFFHDDIASMTF